MHGSENRPDGDQKIQEMADYVFAGRE